MQMRKCVGKATFWRLFSSLAERLFTPRNAISFCPDRFISFCGVFFLFSFLTPLHRLACTLLAEWISSHGDDETCYSLWGSRAAQFARECFHMKTEHQQNQEQNQSRKCFIIVSWWLVLLKGHLWRIKRESYSYYYSLMESIIFVFGKWGINILQSGILKEDVLSDWSILLQKQLCVCVLYVLLGAITPYTLYFDNLFYNRDICDQPWNIIRRFIKLGLFLFLNVNKLPLCPWPEITGLCGQKRRGVGAVWIAPRHNCMWNNK